MNVYAILFLFFGLYLSVSIWIFLIITDSFKRISMKGFFRVQQDFVKAVDMHFLLLSENQMVSQEGIDFICKKFNRKRNKRYFLQQFIYNVEKINNKNYIKDYFKIIFPYLSEILQFEQKMYYSERSYRLMLLGEFRQDTEEINQLILDALDDESFDVRTNALRSLSIIGNFDYFNRGLIKVCSSDKYFNPRHIKEIIAKFEGDRESLKKMMIDSFYKNSPSYRYQVIVYLTDCGSSSSIDFVINYLQHNLDNKEVVIICLRYFAVCEINTKVKAIIFSLLTHEDDEVRAIVVKLTPMYFKDNPGVIGMLSGEMYLKSKEWYIRKNSAVALVKMGLTKEDLINKLSIEDNYAKDALIYAMFEEGFITYEEFMQLGGGQIDERYARDCG